MKLKVQGSLYSRPYGLKESFIHCAGAQWSPAATYLVLIDLV